jgi:D-alanyl-lipoteichoic acid acyltransferase DltB (MBOAT superfamily)
LLAVAAARSSDQFISLDAEETLAKFMVKGWPDDRLFAEVIRDILKRAGRIASLGLKHFSVTEERFADYLADNLVNRVFDFPKLYTGAETLIAVYAYALQLYYDFSGYTDIAIGSALLLAVKLPQNFNMPYAAESIADFWRRWHITLSNWLRDYLYFSLPGLRSKWKVFTYSNLILTMLLGGLWHGASWNFVIWGLLHGCGLALTRAIQGERKLSETGWGRIAR